MTDIFSNWFANIKFSKNPISQQFVQQPIFAVDDSIQRLANQSHGSEVVHPSTIPNKRNKNAGRLEDYLQTQQKPQGTCGLTSVE